MSSHVFLKDRVGVTIDIDECDNFEELIGALNSVLEEQYKCQIGYDESEVIDTGKTIFNGFMVEALDKENPMPQAIATIKEYLNDVEIDGWENLHTDLDDLLEKVEDDIKIQEKSDE